MTREISESITIYTDGSIVYEELDSFGEVTYRKVATDIYAQNAMAMAIGQIEEQGVEV